MASILAILIYLGVWALLLTKITRRETPNRAIFLGLTAFAMTIHLVSLHQSMLADGGIYLGVFKVSSLFLWVINVIVCLSCIKKPLLNLFLGLLPLSIVSIILSASLDSPLTESASIDGGLISHILLSIIAYSLLTIATLQALLLAYQTNSLHNRHPGKIIGLMPPLQTMETLMFELVWAGMIFLTLSIATGFIFVDDFLAQKLTHKTVFSVLSWLIYAVLLGARHFIGWRGLTAIKWVIGGFVALMLAYFGSKIVLEVILRVSA